MRKLLIKDVKKRKIIEKKEKKMLWCRVFLLNPKLNFFLKKNLSIFWFLSYKKIHFVSLKNRCNFTARGKAIYSALGVSRLFLREFGSFGKINGIQKASW